MAAKTLPITILIRSDSQANWETEDPVLANKEFITVRMTSGEVKHKVGDGVHNYSDLPFDDEYIYEELNDKLSASDVSWFHF